jgi:hypothetical protein
MSKQTFTCAKCTKVYKTSGAFNNHMLKEHQDVSETSSLNDKSVRKTILNLSHEQAKHEDKSIDHHSKQQGKQAEPEEVKSEEGEFGKARQYARKLPEKCVITDEFFFVINWIYNRICGAHELITSSPLEVGAKIRQAIDARTDYNVVDDTYIVFNDDLEMVKVDKDLVSDIAAFCLIKKLKMTSAYQLVANFDSLYKEKTRSVVDARLHIWVNFLNNDGNIQKVKEELFMGFRNGL